MLYHAWIGLRINYAAEVHLNTKGTLLSELRTFQNRVLKILFAKSKYHNTKILYKNLRY